MATDRSRKQRLSAVLRAVAVLAMVTVGAADAVRPPAHLTPPSHHAAPHTTPLAASPAHPPRSSAPQRSQQTTARPAISSVHTAQQPALVSAPVAHPDDDFLGSTITAHEGKQSPPPAPPQPGGTLPGLDVSHHQGTVNWTAVAASGARFSYLKATEGTGFVDGQFSTNFSGSRAAGLFRGAYHFALPDRSSGAAQASFFVDHGGGWTANSATLPPVIDMEYNPYGPTCYGLSQAQMSAWVADFSTTVHNRTTRWPMIYTTKNWWSACVGNATGTVRNDPLWLARYNTNPGALPAGWAFYTIWQYDDAGIFPGDQDVFSGSTDQLRSFAGGRGPIVLHNPRPTAPRPAPKPAPPPTPQPTRAIPLLTTPAPAKPTTAPPPTTTQPPTTTTAPPSSTTEPPPTTTTTAPQSSSADPPSSSAQPPASPAEPPSTSATSSSTSTEPAPTTSAPPATTTN